MTCRRCEGTGEVLAVDGRPLAVSARRGLARLQRFWADQSYCMLEAAKLPRATPNYISRALKAIFGGSDFTAVSCPDCKRPQARAHQQEPEAAPRRKEP